MKQCKICQQNKEHILKGLSSNGNNIYVDAEGGRWHGKTYYSCFKNRMQSRYSPKEKQKSICARCGSEFTKNRLDTRFCSRKCINADYYITKKSQG